MKSMAFSAPLLMLLYGVLRWLDGLDGHHDKDGAAWKVGHVAFFVAMALFAVLAVALARRATRAPRVAVVAAAAAVFGAGCFDWVIAGDLSRSFRDRWPLPDALQIAGPLLFVVGLVALLSLEVAAGRLPVWSPILLFVGYSSITISLDLLPIASLVILASMAPIGRGAATARKSETVHS